MTLMFASRLSSPHFKLEASATKKKGPEGKSLRLGERQLLHLPFQSSGICPQRGHGGGAAVGPQASIGAAMSPMRQPVV